MIAPLTFAALLSSCAPSVSVDTMRAIVAVESGGNPYAIHDNSTRRSYFPRSRTEAEGLLTALHSHNLDVGIAQVNTGWFSVFGVSSTQMLEPCRNLRIGSVILTRAYREANANFPQPRLALWHAISAYNTGSLYAGAAYVAQVIDAALSPPIVPSIALLTTSPPVSMPLPDRDNYSKPESSPATSGLAVYHARDRDERSSNRIRSPAIHGL
jgi:type IV secretion system protein VirB1